MLILLRSWIAIISIIKCLWYFIYLDEDLIFCSISLFEGSIPWVWPPYLIRVHKAASLTDIQEWSIQEESCNEIWQNTLSTVNVEERVLWLNVFTPNEDSDSDESSQDTSDNSLWKRSFDPIDAVNLLETKGWTKDHTYLEIHDRRSWKCLEDTKTVRA